MRRKVNRGRYQQSVALGPAFVEQLVVDKNDGLTVERAAPYVVTGMAIFLLVPMQHGAELLAIIAELLTASASTPRWKPSDRQ